MGPPREPGNTEPVTALDPPRHPLRRVFGPLATRDFRAEYLWLWLTAPLTVFALLSFLVVLALGLWLTPVLLGLRYGRPVFELTSRLTSLIPRTNYLVDIGLDWVRQRPGPSGAVLEGLLLGETAPHREQRRLIEAPTLIVGHPRDPVHPFSDSGMLAEELPNARLVEASSIFEWRFKPERLTAELNAFLAELA